MKRGYCTEDREREGIVPRIKRHTEDWEREGKRYKENKYRYKESKNTVKTVDIDDSLQRQREQETSKKRSETEL